MSYIVKNCSSCRYTPKRYIDGIDYICWNAQNFNSSARGLCQDCTDCIIKQVIEKCRAKKLDIYNPSIGNEHYALANSVLSTQILQLFDIEEINK